jgi:prevent-host-death family protein
MITTGLKEAKNNLSRYLAQVRAGEEILITVHGKPVARIIRENQRDQLLKEKLAPLVRKGLILWPTRPLAKDNLSPIEVPGKSVSEMVIEDRRWIPAPW